MQQAQCIRTDHGDIDSTATHKAHKPGWQRPHAVCTFHAEFLTGQGWIVEEIEPYTEDVTDLFTGAASKYRVGMATKTEIRDMMVTALDGATDAQLIEMHAIAYTMLWAASLDETPTITTTMATIETQFERRGIPHCADCGCPNGRHEPDFCSEVAR